MTDCLMVFARFPEVGKCKTRLIDALGAQGAADLHRGMTVHTLDWAQRLLDTKRCTLQVHFSGGDRNAMAQAFGESLQYIPQVDGDLGAKMRSAFDHATSTGASKILVVGTDCPELDEMYAQQAFDALNSHEVCFAPALDGGYALLGIRLDSSQPENIQDRVYDALFKSIAWGTERVLRQTLDALSALPCRVCLLRAVCDVDYPKDLDVWERVQTGQPTPTPYLTVIIPIAGAEKRLPQAIESAQRESAVEVIVVDALDENATHGHFTIQTAADQKTQLIRSPRNRGLQMNAGAALARAENLLFLHADTLLPLDYLERIQHALANEDTVGGAFELHIDSPKLAARWVERGVRWRSRGLSLPYGDQAIFVRRSVFKQLGGFKTLPIMEDFELVRRLNRLGRIAICAAPVTTSPRRWDKLGFLRTTLINQAMLGGYYCGVPIEKLANVYRRKRR